MLHRRQLLRWFSAVPLIGFAKSYAGEGSVIQSRGLDEIVDSIIERNKHFAKCTRLTFNQTRWRKLKFFGCSKELPVLWTCWGNTDNTHNFDISHVVNLDDFDEQVPYIPKYYITHKLALHYKVPIEKVKIC